MPLKGLGLFIFWAASFMLPVWASTIDRPLATSDWNTWLRLLHFEDGRSAIDSDYFFVSPVGNRNPSEELTETLRLFQGPTGRDAACEFPARYSFLAPLYGLPKLDLGTCNELGQFLRSIPGDQVGLAYASEYIDAPASAFGHVSLIVWNSSEPLEAGVILGFAADTGNSSGLRYALDGLSGGFFGYYTLEPIFKKAFYYNKVEQRSVHYYRYNRLGMDLQSFKQHLFELRKARFRYYFTHQNCATRIEALVRVLDNTKGDMGPMPAFPLDVVRNRRYHLEYLSTALPTFVKIDQALQGLDASGRFRLEQLIRGVAAEGDPTGVPGDAPRIVHDFREYNHRRLRLAQAPVETSVDLPFTPYETDFSKAIGLPSDRNGVSRFGLGAQFQEGQAKATLSYRLAQSDKFDPPYRGYRGVASNFLDAAAEITGQDVRVSRFNLIDVDAPIPANRLLSPISWMFSVGADRLNPEEALAVNVKLGAGKTVHAGAGTASLYGVAWLEEGQPIKDSPYGYRIHLQHPVGQIATVGLDHFSKRYPGQTQDYSELYFGVSPRQAGMAGTLVVYAQQDATEDFALGLRYYVYW